jgi:hypothetical protein
MEQEQEKMQRWTAKRRAALVIEILRGDTSAQEAAQACIPSIYGQR